MTDSTLVKKNVTLEEYLALPETMQHVELINGEIIEMPSPEANHQDVVGNCFLMLKIRAKEIGGKVYVSPLDVILDHGNVVQPDVLWIAPEGSKCIIDRFTKRLHGAPDLVVEVLSPGNTYHDRRTKFKLYQQHGVREYWMIDPREKLVEVWVLRDGKFDFLDAYGENETFTSTLVGAVEVNAFFAE